MHAPTEPRPLHHPSDDAVVGRVRAGELADFEILMRRYNRRLYRAARAILGDAAEADDVVQDAYVRAYANLAQFAGRSSFGTWLTRIAVHEALARLRRRGRSADLEETMPFVPSDTPGPEDTAVRHELARALENAIDALPPAYRAVFMLREVEGLSTAETADSLDLNEQTTKTRLHRARTLLRTRLASSVSASLSDTYRFDGARCDAIVSGVMARITGRTTS
jgi:RNA polymerase sigma-70 factor (ECF subfamily)